MALLDYLIASLVAIAAITVLIWSAAAVTVLAGLSLLSIQCCPVQPDVHATKLR